MTQKQIEKNTHYTILAEVMHMIQIFFGTLFWIYLISVIIFQHKIFIDHARLLATSILLFVIAIYTVMKFDEKGKHPTLVACSTIIFLLAGVGFFGVYSYKVCRELPVRSYMISIISILTYAFTKELRKEYKRKIKKK